MGTLKMASTLTRLCVRGSNLLRNSQAVTGASRTISVGAMKSKDYTFNDPIEHATGPDKYELMQAQAGNDDPFFLKVKQRSDFKGTKDEPIIVDALDTFRMVGCVCDEHDCHIKWMWLIEGKNKRCSCGHWFALKSHPPVDRYALPL